MLGLPSDDKEILLILRTGSEFAPNAELLGRIDHLLVIDQALGLIFKGSPDRRYGWITEANRNFDHQFPLVFLEQGCEGILAVRRYLDFERGF